MSATSNITTHNIVRLVAIGAGNRMRTYMHYLEEHPEEAQLVAVVDPAQFRRNRMGDKLGVPMHRRYADYSAFFKDKVDADAVIICTPDDQHYRPCMQAIRNGYHVLLEKPIAQTRQQCERICQAAHRHHVIVSICHVLRYHPTFLKIKQIVDSGELGQIISVNYTEGVGLDRATHSYVRGSWRRKETSNSMLLAKCCHDVDYLLWLTESPCRHLASYGTLRWFRSANAPKGSALRCLDCQVEDKCPYSAKDLYLRRHEWIRNFDVPDGKSLDEVIIEELKHGPLGRCVYHCDNDVVDHQVLLMQLENETTITLSMDIYTLQDHRQITLHGTHGELSSDESTISITTFRPRKTVSYDFTDLVRQPYHGGADMHIISDFIKAVRGEETHLPSLIDDALKSHIVCFEAERYRQKYS